MIRQRVFSVRMPKARTLETLRELDGKWWWLLVPTKYNNALSAAISAVSLTPEDATIEEEQQRP